MENENNRREFISMGLAAGLVGGVTMSTGADAAPLARSAAAPKLTGLDPDGAPSADSGYTPGISAPVGQKVIFVSGQGPIDYDADMETQMRQTFDRIGKVLREGGADWENVVILRSFFVNISRDLPVYRKVRKDYLKAPFPASTAVGTPELAIPGLGIEIEAVAII